MEAKRGARGYWLICLPFWIGSANADELWLLELEGDDGIQLQFQGAEVERGSATILCEGEPCRSPLHAGDQLALWVAEGVASRIEVLSKRTSLPAEAWLRAEDRVVRFDGHHLQLARLEPVVVEQTTRWVNGGAADLQAGRQLVLTRDSSGQLLEILIVNPEDDPEDLAADQ